MLCLDNAGDDAAGTVLAWMNGCLSAKVRGLHMQLSVPDVAIHLDVTEETVYAWIHKGFIPFFKVNGQYRLNSADVLEWAVAHGHRLSLDIIRKTHGDPGDAMLVQALEAGGLHKLEQPVGRAELLWALVEGSGGQEPEDRAILLEMLKASEALGPTGLGGGVAIPHVRTPVVVHGALASIATWYLGCPVDFFKAADGIPVDTVFFIVTPAPRAHLHLVSQLMMALQDPAFRKALKERASLEVLLTVARRLAVPDALKNPAAENGGSVP